jgi:DNA-binding beta-propeller fold protein YncE
MSRNFPIIGDNMRRLFRQRLLFCVSCAAFVLAATNSGQNRPAARVQAPRFEVDPLWPKPLPNHWLMGSVITVSVDDKDNVWIIHRPSSLNETEVGASLNPPAGECCIAAPPVLAFDPEGNLIKHWGGPGEGYEWPSANHALTVDPSGNVWISGNGGPDSHILKFTKDGKFLKQFGRSGARRTGPPDANGQPSIVANSHDPENFGRVASIFVDLKASEAYIGDGYLNKRVAVIDTESGKVKRYWGAYGNKPDDSKVLQYNPDDPPAQQFGNRPGLPPTTSVHCAKLSKDRLLYVCDRPNDRIQIFNPDGKFAKEVFIAKRSLGEGSVWDLEFSPDAGQKYIYVADGRNSKIHILRRDTLEVLTTFGDGGRQPGQFFGVHGIAVDSKGNIYTTETYEGKRVQKFTYKGEAPVTAKDQGVVWPPRKN